MTGPAPESPPTEYVEDVLDDQPSAAPEGQPEGAPAAEGSQALARRPPEEPPPAVAGQPGEAAPASSPPSAAPSGQAPSPPAAPSAPQFPAFTYTAGREELDFPGSKRGRDGAFFPNETLPELSRLLSQGVYHERHWQQELADRDAAWQQRIAEAEDKGAKGHAVLAALERLRAQGPEAMAKWLDDLDRNWPLLMAKAENDLLQQRLQTVEASQREYRETEQAQALVPHLEDTLWQTVETICADPRAKALDPTTFYNRLVDGFLDQIFTEGEEVDPRTGGKRVVCDYDVILREADYEIDMLARAAAAARHNAGVLTAPTAPPTVTAAGTPVLGTEERHAAPKFKSQEEYFDWLETDAGRAWRAQFSG